MTTRAAWLFAQNSASYYSACTHAQITLANDEEPSLGCRSCGKRWTFVPAGSTPRYCADDDPEYPSMLDNRGWPNTARVAMTADDDPSAARVVELEAELAEIREIADLVDDADIATLPPELLAVKQRWIAERRGECAL